jgi:hypothetical protein
MTFSAGVNGPTSSSFSLSGPARVSLDWARLPCSFRRCVVLAHGPESRVERAIVGGAVVESLRATKCEATAAEMLRMDLFNFARY